MRINKKRGVRQGAEMRQSGRYTNRRGHDSERCGSERSTRKKKGHSEGRGVQSERQSGEVKAKETAGARVVEEQSGRDGAGAGWPEGYSALVHCRNFVDGALHM